MLKIRIIVGLISLFFLIIILEAIRRRKFMERHAILWLIAGLSMLGFSIFPNILFKISYSIGLYYLTVLLLICFVFLLLIMFYLSICISQLTEKNKELAQQIGLLKEKLERKKDKDGSDKTA